MNTILNIQILAPAKKSSKLRSLFPPLKKIQIHTVTQFPDNYRQKENKDLIITWINSDSIQKLQRLNYTESDSSVIQDIIYVGESIKAADALMLGQFGIARVFDLDSDSDKFTSHVLDRYDIWKKQKAIEKESLDLKRTIIGNCDSIKRLRDMIYTVAEKDRLTVLVRGETGVGKGLVSNAIHKLSSRVNKPFIEINCTAVPDTLIDAELFGHEKGAFTDAHRSRRGIFELAHKGSLFLDEIGYLKQETQVKLLKVLEDKEFRRLGGEDKIRVDCRIISGTSVNLEQAIKNGSFRADLYYRLNVFPVWIPPLRERENDIIQLADHFKQQYCEDHSVAVTNFTKESKQLLIDHSWPGNIRELKHTIERAVILSDGKPITPESLLSMTEVQPAKKQSSGNSIEITIPSSGISMKIIQHEIVKQVLEMTSGNKSEAARWLNISRSRLLRKLQED